MPYAMDAGATDDGRIRAAIAVRLPDRPLAPWLRLAHITRTPAERAPDRGHARTIRDFMLMLQIEGDSWIWWRDAGGAVPMPRGSIAFVPPGFVHAWGETAGAHVAVHFDLHARPELVPLAMLRPLGQVVHGEPAVRSPWFRLARGDGRDPLLVPLVTPLRAPERWRER